MESTKTSKLGSTGVRVALNDAGGNEPTNPVFPGRPSGQVDL
jgi:hypothetical protein